MCVFVCIYVCMHVCDGFELKHFLRMCSEFDPFCLSFTVSLFLPHCYMALLTVRTCLEAHCAHFCQYYCTPDDKVWGIWTPVIKIGGFAGITVSVFLSARLFLCLPGLCSDFF